MSDAQTTYFEFHLTSSFISNGVSSLLSVLEKQLPLQNCTYNQTLEGKEQDFNDQQNKAATMFSILEYCLEVLYLPVVNIVV